MNLSEFRTALERRSGVDMSQGAMDQHINAAIQYIDAVRNWSWVENTETIVGVSGQLVYPLPTDWKRTQALVAQDQSYQYVNISAIDEFNNRDWNAYIYMFAIIDDEIHVRPEPTGQYDFTHRYIRVEPALVDDTDEPFLPARFHPAVVSLAAAYEWENRDGRQAIMRSERFRRDYENWERRMYDEQNKSTTPKQVNIRQGSYIW